MFDIKKLIEVYRRSMLDLLNYMSLGAVALWFISLPWHYDERGDAAARLAWGGLIAASLIATKRCDLGQPAVNYFIIATLFVRELLWAQSVAKHERGLFAPQLVVIHWFPLLCLFCFTPRVAELVLFGLQLPLALSFLALLRYRHVDNEKEVNAVLFYHSIVFTGISISCGLLSRIFRRLSILYGDMNRVVKHELRTPIAAVLGLCDLYLGEREVGAGPDGDAAVAEATFSHAAVLSTLTHIKHCMLHIGGTLDAVMTVASEDAPRSAAAAAAAAASCAAPAITFDCVRLCDEAARMCRLENLTTADTTLRACRCDDNMSRERLRYVRGDAFALQQIVLALLGNALKYTHDGHVQVLLRAGPCDACESGTAGVENATGNTAAAAAATAAAATTTTTTTTATTATTDTVTPSNEVWLTMDVLDTGSGTAAADEKRIFEPSFRSARDKQGGVAGSGMGLSVVKHLVEGMRGTVEVCRSTMDLSITMRVRIPLLHVCNMKDVEAENKEIKAGLIEAGKEGAEEVVDEMDEDAEEEEDEEEVVVEEKIRLSGEETVQASKSAAFPTYQPVMAPHEDKEGADAWPKVIYAEDNALLRRIGAAHLRRHGLHVVECRDGEEAVAAYIAHAWTARPCGVLLDLEMPTCDGAAAARRVRALQRTEPRHFARAPLLLLTAHSPDTMRSRVQSLGGDGDAAALFDGFFEKTGHAPAWHTIGQVFKIGLQQQQPGS